MSADDSGTRGRQADERDPLACPCGHGLIWHDPRQGCGYLGFNVAQRCPCLLPFHEAIRKALAQAWDEGYVAGNAFGYEYAQDTYEGPGEDPTVNPHLIAGGESDG